MCWILTAHMLQGVESSSLQMSVYSNSSTLCLQDAHCGADLEHSLLPSIHLADGHLRRSSQTNALLDMWHAMENAQHLIYITNWHFNPDTRNPFDESLPTIGELLKKKSGQGT